MKFDTEEWYRSSSTYFSVKAEEQQWMLYVKTYIYLSARRERYVAK
jgi:hypothetical protein